SGNFRSHSGKWGSGGGWLCGADQARPAHDLPAPRLLAADRHRQPADRAGRGVLARRQALGAVGGMIRLTAARLGRIVALGAHCDDIAIGAGGTLLTLCAGRPGLQIDALVLSGGGTEREDEEHAALTAFCPGADLRLTVLKLPDGRLPAHWEQAKEALELLRARTD